MSPLEELRADGRLGPEGARLLYRVVRTVGVVQEPAAGEHPLVRHGLLRPQVGDPLLRRVGVHSDAGFEVGLEMVAKARRLRLPIAEVPTIWLDRTQGVSQFRVAAWIPKYLRWYLFAFGPRLTFEELAAKLPVAR